MTGPTALTLILRNLKNVVHSSQNIVKVTFPQKTVVSSAQLNDDMGRPVYRRDIHV